MDAPKNSINNQAAGNATSAPKATIRLQPKAVAPEQVASPTGVVPRPAAAPKATIRLQPKAVAPEEVASPTGVVPRPAAAPKATIRLQPKAVAPEQVATPTGSVPRPAAAPKATIRLQPKVAKGMDESASTVEVPRLSKSGSPTVKLQATGQTGTQSLPNKANATSNKTIRLVPKAGKTQSGMIPSDGVKPSSPTVKLSSGVKPSSPTVKLSTGAKPSSPTVKLGAVKQNDAKSTVEPVAEIDEPMVEFEEETSVLFTIASVASLLALCGSAALLFMSYSSIW